MYVILKVKKINKPVQLAEVQLPDAVHVIRLVLVWNQASHVTTAVSWYWLAPGTDRVATPCVIVGRLPHAFETYIYIYSLTYQIKQW
jgi:hypothetical protein